RVPTSTSLDVGKVGALTLEGWIKPTVAGTMPILDWSPSGAYGAHVWIASNQALYVDLVDAVGSSHIIQSPNGQIQTGTFQHIALTYDKPSGLARLYWNGTMVAASTLGGFTPRTSTDLFIGYRTTGAPYGPAYFKGLLDEMTLYNQALSANEIQ